MKLNLCGNYAMSSVYRLCSTTLVPYTGTRDYSVTANVGLRHNLLPTCEQRKKQLLDNEID